jgi:tetratricopeptide (TPR) repeat protein
MLIRTDFEKRTKPVNNLYANIAVHYYALCRTGMVLALLVPLAACVSNQPEKVAAQPEKVKIQPEKVAAQPEKVAVQPEKQQVVQANPQINQINIPKASPRARAEFLAAMQSIKSVEYERTIKLLNKVIAQTPGNPVPYINLAIVYKKMQNWTLAEENLKLALQIDSDNPVANNELALVYRKTGRFTQAREVYEAILAKYPNFLIARKNLGVLCDLYMRDYSCAVKNYVIYSDARPDDAPVKIWIADLKGR